MNFPNKLEVQHEEGEWAEITCLGVGLVAKVICVEHAHTIAHAVNMMADPYAGIAADFASPDMHEVYEASQ